MLTLCSARMSSEVEKGKGMGATAAPEAHWGPDKLWV